jgi:hypothetical protein
MAKLNISEFQFSFAFFHMFMSLEKNFGKSFEVPSLRQEGGNGDLAGLDLKIGEEYFFQFKMADRLKTQRAREILNQNLKDDFLPYFRFNVKNSNNSNQFNTLVELANKVGANKVYYVSPLFNYSNNNTSDEEAFKDFWTSNPSNALEKICYIDFHQFVNSNPLLTETNNNHVICYNSDSIKSNLGYLLSEPKKIKISSKIGQINEIENIDLHIRIMDLIKIFDLKEILKIRRDIIIDELLEVENKIGYNHLFKIVQDEILVNYNLVWIPEIIKNI